MDSARLIRSLRARAGLSLRELAQRAGTSHSTLAAYESGRVTPSVSTLDRIAGAAGFSLAVDAYPAIDAADRGRELEAVLELAALFPARHAERLEYPQFGTR